MFRMKRPYSKNDEEDKRRLIDIDNIYLFRESGVPFEPTITLETHHVSWFEFNKIEYENEVYDCRNLNDVLQAIESIEKKMEKNKQ